MTAATAPFDPIPTDPATVLDPEWLAQALDVVADGDRVVAVEQTGSSRTIAEKVRFAVTVEARRRRPPDLPAVRQGALRRDQLPHHRGARLPRPPPPPRGQGAAGATTAASTTPRAAG